MDLVSDRILRFYNSLDIPKGIPDDIEVLNPFKESRVQKIIEEFYARFYSDRNKRVFLIGINPGRFGAGVTGLPFTDPIRLQSLLPKYQIPGGRELSSVFIYELIEAFGGVDQFYSTFYFISVSPLGFTSKGKNLNYYDSRPLFESIKPWMIVQMEKQLYGWGDKSTAVVIGKGDNLKHFKALNEQNRWFGEVVSIPHPRWVMQYRLKKKDLYIHEIVKILSSL
jgi:hypothetical protein